jgi:hypothetical protein
LLESGTWFCHSSSAGTLSFGSERRAEIALNQIKPS